MTKKSTENKVIVAGVGMIPFAKPGASETYDIMGAKAAKLALRDSGVDYKNIQSAFVGYVFGDSYIRSAGFVSCWHDRYSNYKCKQ